MSLSVAVVTCTIGRKELEKAIESVKEQTRKATHYVFVHGREYKKAAHEVLLKHPDVIPVYLPHNTHQSDANGCGYGMAGVYALAPYVVTEDVVCLLDDDNWYDPTHIENTVGMLEERDLGWVYALRKLVDQHGNYLLDDNCESLGMHPNATGHYLVDNSCFVVRAEHAKRYGHAWYVRVVSDRSFQRALMDAKLRCGTTGEHSVNYRISTDTPVSMPVAAFEANNKFMEQKYNGAFPWKQRAIFNY